MMYFCPCSCNDPIDPETEEHALVALPRNLSYVQESYLDRYSVSARFVHNPKIERSLQHEQELERAANVEAEQQRLLAAALRSEDSFFSSSFRKTNCSPLEISNIGQFYGNSHHSLNGACSSGSGVSNGSDDAGGYHSVDGYVCHRPECVHSNNTPVVVSASNSNPRYFTQSVPDSPLASQFEAQCPFPPIPPHVEPIRQHSLLQQQQEDPKQKQQQQKELPVKAEPSSGFHTGSILGPAVRVASKLSSLLQSPPNESMDDQRDVDIGSSVDGDIPTTVSQTLAWNPDQLDQKIDRGLDISNNQQQNMASNGESTTPPHRHVVICDQNISVTVREYEVSDEFDSDLTSESEGQPQLYPKPFGHGGKTFFPRDDLSLSSSDPDEDVPIEENEEENTEVDIQNNVEEVTTVKPHPSYESPDSDAFSEEGVFVNMDDLDSTNERSNTVSEVSDDTCVSVDSVILSPEEGELEEEIEVAQQPVKEPPRKMSLEEAISRAAKDLSKWTMGHEEQNDREKAVKQEVSSAMEDSTTTLEGDESEGEAGSAPRPTLASLGRTSPVRSTGGLKIKISTSETETKISDSNTDIDSPDTSHSESPVYEDSEFNFCRTGLRKSSSLKTNKTPPGTPHRKKVVRFADAMGLDLESVRHVLNMESPPRIPPSAMADLRAGLDDDRREIGSRYLCACFSQPGAEDNFSHRVLSQKVALENAIITDLTITGIVRVANITFHKSVRVRYTHNNWATFHDIAATYVQNSCDGPTDRFSFSIVAPADFCSGRRLEFAVSYNAGGQEYWDSNNGRNYAFECFAKTVPTAGETAWMHFI